MTLLSKRDILAGIAGCAAIPAIPSHAETAVRHEIDITQFEFLPEVLEVKTGDEVRWLNSDLAPHTATASDESWDTGGLEKGEAGVVVVTRDMTPDYYCAYHPHMKGRLRIVG